MYFLTVLIPKSSLYMVSLYKWAGAEYCFSESSIFTSNSILNNYHKLLLGVLVTWTEISSPWKDQSGDKQPPIWRRISLGSQKKCLEHTCAFTKRHAFITMPRNFLCLNIESYYFSWQRERWLAKDLPLYVHS